MAPDKRRARPAMLGAVAAAILVAVVVYFLTRGNEDSRGVIRSTGVVEATEVEITSKIPGRIDWICCSEGDAVKAGQAVVRLDSAELRARVEEARANAAGAAESLNEARVNLDTANVTAVSATYDVNAAIAEAARIKAVLDDSKTNLERARGLFKDGYMARKDLDAADTLYNSYAAQYESARARQKSAEAGRRTAEVNIKAAMARIQTAEARLTESNARLKAAEAGLADTEIYSPIDGVAVYKAFERGEVVSPGASILTIDDLKSLWARVDIEETEMHRIRLGDRAAIYPSGNEGAAFEGRVIEAGEAGGFATQRDVTRGRSDIKTFRVKAGILDPRGLLKPGMTVKVEIYTDTAKK